MVSPGTAKPGLLLRIQRKGQALAAQVVQLAGHHSLLADGPAGGHPGQESLQDSAKSCAKAGDSNGLF